MTAHVFSVLLSAQALQLLPCPFSSLSLSSHGALISLTPVFLHYTQ